MLCGIGVDNSCIEFYQELKLKRKYLYIVYSIAEDNKSIVIERKIERKKVMFSTEEESKQEYEEFVKSLPEKDCRYIAYDFEFEKQEGEGMRNKICFIVWSPSVSSIKKKMHYASSKEAIRNVLPGIAAEIQATDYDEVSFDSVKGRVKGF